MFIVTPVVCVLIKTVRCNFVMQNIPSAFPGAQSGTAAERRIHAAASPHNSTFCRINPAFLPKRCAGFFAVFPWAVVYKDMLKEPATRNLILGSMVSFLAILFAGYLYAVKKKAFDWKS
jgi:hypothetical protein